MKIVYLHGPDREDTWIDALDEGLTTYAAGGGDGAAAHGAGAPAVGELMAAEGR